MPFHSRWKRQGPLGKPTHRKPLSAFGVWAALAILLATPVWAESLPREWAIGLPEPSEYVEPEDQANAFCPLGVCRPRSRDSLYASAAFGLAALASAYVGRSRKRKPPSPETEAEL